MSSAEVAKKKGRPKKTIAETITILAEPVAAKVKKPRIPRKSTTISPNHHLEEKVSTSARASKNDVSLPSPPQAIKEPKSRSMKSVAAETAILASRQVKAPSTRPEPSLILKQATAFVQGQKPNSLSTSSESVKVDPQGRPKEFKPAGPLPASSGLEVSKPATSTSSTRSLPKTSPFLADFFTEPISAEQPAWSRPKRPATVSSSLKTSPQSTKAGGVATPLVRSDTSASAASSSSSSSAPPQPPDPKSPIQTVPESRISQEPASTIESQSAALLTPSTHPSQLPSQPATAPNTLAKSTPEAAMSTNPPTEGLNSTPSPSPSPNTISQPPRRVGPSPKMPPRVPNAGGPKPLKPTETPYEVLRHDPKFKALSRRWTSLIVAIPILVATSYALYGRYTNTAVQRTRVRDQGTSTINGGV